MMGSCPTKPHHVCDARGPFGLRSFRLVWCFCSPFTHQIIIIIMKLVATRVVVVVVYLALAIVAGPTTVHGRDAVPSKESATTSSPSPSSFERLCTNLHAQVSGNMDCTCDDYTQNSTLARLARESKRIQCQSIHPTCSSSSSNDNAAADGDNDEDGVSCGLFSLTARFMGDDFWSLSSCVEYTNSSSSSTNNNNLEPEATNNPPSTNTTAHQKYQNRCITWEYQGQRRPQTCRAAVANQNHKDNEDDDEDDDAWESCSSCQIIPQSTSGDNDSDKSNKSNNAFSMHLNCWDDWVVEYNNHNPKDAGFRIERWFPGFETLGTMTTPSSSGPRPTGSRAVLGASLWALFALLVLSS
mmetsp:Transcript_22360/g.48645  ORF Transcript_22360/g.48645 Transcript_22360/m.48645 type:complete len:355 (+) Transcript_22360:213-1277(+)